MSLENLKTELENDIKNILSTDFDVTVTDTSSVPTIDTPGITYPNLDNKEMKAKRIHTCVLYIDIRKSTELNLQHKPNTLTKLYASFMRSMVKAAQYFNGRVRNIIGDRIMVVFDEENCFENAVHTACLLNTVSKYVLNKHFKNSEVTCGIGIDYGRMLVSKGGIVKNGNENSPYKSLVWLGRPANVASKLTDLANKAVEIKVKSEENFISVNEQIHIDKSKFRYYDISYNKFFNEVFEQRPDMRLIKNTGGKRHYHSSRPTVAGFRPTTKTIEKISQMNTPPILMTEKVYEEYKKAKPDQPGITKSHWKKQDTNLYPSYVVYGGDLSYPNMRV